MVAPSSFSAMQVAKLLIPALLLTACSAGAQTDSTTSRETTFITTTITAPPGDTADVVHIFDGDSFVAGLQDGSEVEVRLIGINAPEGSECFGDESRDALTSWLSSGAITLVSDSQVTDQFNRELRHVYVNGVNVNIEMLRSGHALVLQTDQDLNAEYLNASEDAADSAHGMWAHDICGADSTPPSVAIVDYVFDPRGRDTEDLNGEWVAIVNRGSSSFDMTGWVLRDESTQNRFEFPKGFMLDPDNEVLVRSGCGTPTTTELFWCARDPVWSNGGDTIILQQDDGAIVTWQRYAEDF